LAAGDLEASAGGIDQRIGEPVPRVVIGRRQLADAGVPGCVLAGARAIELDRLRRMAAGVAVDDRDGDRLAPAERAALRRRQLDGEGLDPLGLAVLGDEEAEEFLAGRA